MNVAANRRLADRYRLADRIAVGGMGEVWQAHDDVLDRTVAVKLLRAEFAADAGYLQRFRDEARHAAALSHPGIASVYDYGEAAGQPFLVLEYVPGDSLATLLARAGGPLSVPQTLDIVGQAALALQAAHEAGIVHRDVKPANLLIRPDGLVKVTDFGIARPAGQAGGDAGDVVEGTAYYLAPEQIAGRPATAASDVYSLGIVAYEALAGRHAFEGPDPSAVARARLQQDPPALPPAVPSRVRALIAAALDRDPQRRPSSAAAFGRRALALAAEPAPAADGGADASATTRVLPVEPEPTTAFAPGTIPPAQRRVRNRLLAAGAVVVLLGAGLIWLVTALSGGPGTVTISPRDYIGRQASAVEQALRRLGVKVTQRDTPSHTARGTVLQVSPSGSVAVGSTVSVTVAVPAAPTPTPAAPTPAAPSAPAAPAPAPGPTGHGHGHAGKDG